MFGECVTRGTFYLKTNRPLPAGRCGCVRIPSTVLSARPQLAPFSSVCPNSLALPLPRLRLRLRRPAPRVTDTGVMDSEGIGYFTLNTGAKMPSLGLGTWQSDPGLVGDAVVAAVKAGYRHIDCARIYKNEKEIGLALRELFEDGVVKREDLFITSKLWCDDLAPEDVADGLDSSLNDLQLDYLDLYLIHWPLQMKKGTGFRHEGFMVPNIPGTWRVMEKLYDSGKVHAIGVSNFSCKKLEDLLSVARIPPAVNQVECHPVWHQQKLHTLCALKGVHFSGYSPLGSPGSTWMKSNVLVNPILNSVSSKLGKTPAQVALRWGIQMGHSVLPKSTNEKRLKENFDIFDWSIPEDLLAKFSEIKQERLMKGDFIVGENSVYKTIAELWDDEI